MASARRRKIDLDGLAGVSAVGKIWLTHNADA